MLCIATEALIKLDFFAERSLIALLPKLNLDVLDLLMI